MQAHLTPASSQPLSSLSTHSCRCNGGRQLMTASSHDQDDVRLDCRIPAESEGRAARSRGPLWDLRDFKTATPYVF